LFALPVTHGRLPLSAASDEALATRALADQDPDVRVGSTIGIDFQGQPHRLRVVGVVDEIGTPTLYASTTAFASVTSLGRVANAVRLKTRPGEIESTAAAVEHALFDAGLQPAQRLTRTMLRDALEEHFQVVGFVLQAAAAAAGVLGTLFLAAAAAAATHERTREIGILRALGATRRHIVALLLAEALTILLAGAAVGTMAALGLTAIMNEAAAQTLLHVSVPFVLSLEAVVLLLGAMLATLAVVALSVGRIVARPARGALCYE
jgi:predicted lysophospholipase L1 biosynthesis ABC-type transport system permease subunit